MESKTPWYRIKDTGVRESFHKSSERELKVLETKWKTFCPGEDCKHIHAFQQASKLVENTVPLREIEFWNQNCYRWLGSENGFFTHTKVFPCTAFWKKHISSKPAVKPQATAKRNMATILQQRWQDPCSLSQKLWRHRIDQKRNSNV